MNEITYRRHFGFSMAVFFITIVLSSIVNFILTFFSPDPDIYPRLTSLVALVFLAVKVLSMGYIAVRPGLCSNVLARIAATAVLLVLMWCVVQNFYTLATGNPMFEVTKNSPVIYRWQSAIIEALLFLTMSVLLFSQRLWTAIKVIGSVDFFVPIILSLGYVYTISKVFDIAYREESMNYLHAYGMLSGIVNLIILILSLLLIVLLFIWANSKPKTK